MATLVRRVVEVTTHARSRTRERFSEEFGNATDNQINIVLTAVAYQGRRVGHVEQSHEFRIGTLKQGRRIVLVLQLDKRQGHIEWWIVKSVLFYDEFLESGMYDKEDLHG